MNNQEAAEERRAISELSALQSELAEQCRLNAMGQEREARLMAEVADKHWQLCKLQSDFEDMHDRAEEAEAELERNRAILAGARNCILKYVPSSIESDRDFTLSTIKVALESKGLE